MKLQLKLKGNKTQFSQLIVILLNLIVFLLNYFSIDGFLTILI